MKPSTPPAGAGISAEQFLAEVARPAEHTPGHHPDDGWTRAQVWPASAFSRKALRGVIEVLLPVAPAPCSPEIYAKVEHHVLWTLPYLPPFNARGFLLLITLLELSPFWRFAGLRRLHKMPRDEASAILKGLTHSRFLALRQLMLAVKGLILPGYYDLEEVHRELDYAPRVFFDQRVAFRGRLMAGEAPQPSDMMGPHSEEIEP